MNNDQSISTILRFLADSLERETPLPIARGITEEAFAAITKLKSSTLRSARRSGAHPENKVWFKCPATGRILYDVQGYNAWLEEMHLVDIQESKPVAKASASSSHTKANGTVRLLNKNLLKPT